MKEIRTTHDTSYLIDTLNLTMNSESPYALVENKMAGIPDCINVFFDYQNLTLAKELLIKAQYYTYSYVRYLLGKKEDDMVIIPFQDILYIEGINNDTYVYTRVDCFKVKEKLYELEERLLKYKFIRISKSYIVHIQAIKRIRSSFNGKLQLILSDVLKLDVSRHYVQAFKSYLGM